MDDLTKEQLERLGKLVQAAYRAGRRNPVGYTDPCSRLDLGREALRYVLEGNQGPDGILARYLNTKEAI